MNLQEQGVGGEEHNSADNNTQFTEVHVLINICQYVQYYKKNRDMEVKIIITDNLPQ